MNIHSYRNACSLILILICETGFSDFYVSPLGDNANSGTCDFPLLTISRAFQLAEPGDTIYLEDGLYNESITTPRGGEKDRPITLTAINPKRATITSTGSQIIRVAFPYITIEGIILDGNFAVDRPIRTRGNDDASHLTISNVEIKNAKNNCIDLSSNSVKENIIIEDCEIHHCILEANGELFDAHGVTGSNVINLQIRNTEIYLVTGDAVQFDPGRSGFWDIIIDQCHFWTGPLPEDVGGIPAGTPIGECGLDTKNSPDLERATVIVKNSIFNGWGHENFPNGAALNLKQNVRATVEGNIFHDTQIGLRIRGPADRGGAIVTAFNNVFYANNRAIWYNTDPVNLHLYNNTFGLDIVTFSTTEDGDPPGAGFEAVNNLFLSDLKPVEMSDATNLAVDSDSFIAAQSHNYHLKLNTPPVDAGIGVGMVTQDKDGNDRPIGSQYDVGAFEFRPNTNPILRNPIPDISASSFRTFSFCVPIDAFFDNEDQEELTYSSNLSDGSPLPLWLSFDESTRIYSGTPGNEDIGILMVEIIARDSNDAMASDLFELTVGKSISFSLSVKKGWNLISLPLQTESTIDELFGANVVGNVWRWAGRQEFVPVLPRSILAPRLAYWIYFMDNDTVTVRGADLVNDQISLTDRWNGIGRVITPDSNLDAVNINDLLVNEP